MKALIESVKTLSLSANRATCKRTFLNSTMIDPACQNLVAKMNAIKPEQLGLEDHDCNYHF